MTKLKKNSAKPVDRRMKTMRPQNLRLARSLEPVRPRPTMIEDSPIGEPFAEQLASILESTWQPKRLPSLRGFLKGLREVVSQ